MQPSPAKLFWSKLEDKPTEESMLLNKEAKSIAPVDAKEILSLLPTRVGLDVVELGAGIGRFTTVIAQEEAKSVFAVDLTEAFCEENRKANVNKSNVVVHCADVKDLDLPDESVDLVFANWLFMYLDDEDVAAVFKGISQWLRPGGHFFLRESCDKPSSTSVLSEMGENPTIYRSKEDYDEMLAALDLTVEKSGGLHTFLEMENLTNQKYWLLRKGDSKQ